MKSPIRKSFFMSKKIALAASLLLCLNSFANAASLNEVRISWPGGDDDVNNFVEIAGTPGESLDGLTLVSMSAEFEPGELSFVIDLAGQTIPDDGFFLASGDDAFYGGQTDLSTGIDYFGSPQVFALVTGFTGAQGDDLDAENDGVLDSEPFSAIVDAIAFIDGDDNDDFVYGIATVGPDGDFPPAHAYRGADGDSAWIAGLFGDAVNDTPGVSNIPEPMAGSLALLSLVGVMSVRRRRS